MIRDFENWNSTLGEVSKLDELRGCTIAIEAADYLNQRILGYPDPKPKEPLLPAIGGLPLGMKQNVYEDLAKFAEYQIQPIFVFSGLDFAKKEDPFRQRQEGAAVNANAWSLYDQHQAEQAVNKFGESNYVTPEDLFRALQSILLQYKVPFQVAPYSAWAQLAYLEKNNYAQAIAGSSELLLFECDKVITGWDFEAKELKWIKRDKCVADLKKFTNNDVSDEMFVDACMLAGTNFLPTLPNLDQPNRGKVLKPLGAIEMMMSFGKSGLAVCLNYQEDPRFQRMHYVDKYRKARLAVKHHPVLTAPGKVEPLAAANLPNDAHEFIGQRLPDEIYYYLSKGVISSRILNWRATSEIIEAPPVDGGDSLEYHNLVSSKLTPLRTTAINLLSSSLHNWYQHKDLTLKCWFLNTSGKPHTTTISMRGLQDTRKLVEKWNVKEAAFKNVISDPYGKLGNAILSLRDTKFASSTVTNKDASNPLASKDEIIYNSIWRFLALREYVDVNHNLTPWGQVLATVITALKGNQDLEEVAVVAVELLRLGILNEDHMFSYNGAPMRGDESDRKYNLLISRVAGLGDLRHKPIGFTGPLSQHLLAYHSMVCAVRSTLRDLVEVSMTQILLGGFAKKDIEGLTFMSMNLPFLLPNTCALSTAVKSYLDELIVQPNPSSPEAKAAVKETASTRYFPQSEDLIADLEIAFNFWDAVFEGIKASGPLVKEDVKKVWYAANNWLSVRR